MKINNFRTSVAAFVLGSATFAVGMFSFSPPAQAEFRVCNKSSETARVAFAFRQEGSWSSRGWSIIESGECTIIYHKPLTNNSYYLYARNKITGDREFCVRGDDFRIVDAKQCEGQGKLVGFLRVDTGGNQDYTFNIHGHNPHPSSDSNQNSD